MVLTGLDAVGATREQAASGLLAVTIMAGLGCIVLARWFRMPITVAWSTPGVALLVATGAVEGGWSAAVGAFLIAGILIVLTGLWPWLGRVIARIPPSLAQAMLAGILLPLCIAPFTGIVANPWGVVPVVLTWLVFVRLAPRWAVPLAFAAAAIVIVIGLVQSRADVDPVALLPRFEFTAPTLTLGAVVGIAIPLYIVTMASQNIPGVAVMRSLGYEIPWRASMLVTGVGTILASPAGGHAVNLGAISAAISAGPDAGPDTRKRWIAAVTAGGTYLVLGAASAAFAALVVWAPAGVIPAVAGLALLGAFGAAVQQAIDDPGERMPAVVTFLVAASGVSVFGVSAAFWALLAGLIVRSTLHLGRRATT